MSRHDQEEPSDSDDAGHEENRSGNLLLIVSMLSAGLLVLLALLYFAY
ncbi:MAG: hypothetical protein GXP06_14805 [Alphaproteobacteria bacterium]|nr:hypothetical protein [Alphaproteobacteria bacterium]